MELFVEQGGLAGQVLPLDQPVTIFGRGGEAAGGRIVLPEEGASRQHARIQYGPEGWVLIDLGSTNGTFLNGQRIPAQTPCPLRPGDRVSMAGTILLFREGREPRADQGPSASEADWEPEHVVSAGAEAMPGERPAKRALHPAILVAGAFLLVVVLVGIVILLVTVLQPAPDLTTPTAGAQMEELIATVVPTEFQDVVTAVAPLMTSLPLPLLGPAATPTP